MKAAVRRLVTVEIVLRHTRIVTSREILSLGTHIGRVLMLPSRRKIFVGGDGYWSARSRPSRHRMRGAASGHDQNLRHRLRRFGEPAIHLIFGKDTQMP